MLQKNPIFLTRIVFLVISIAMLLAMFLINPVRKGDGIEYFLMTESLFNHLSPDLQLEDIETYKQLKIKFNFDDRARDDRYYKMYTLEGPYFKAKDNKRYCYHFWAYPAFSLPVKYILHFFNLSELKAFQVTNAMLLILALFSIVFVLPASELQKMFFIFLIVFCPAFWFIRWPHPEIFSYSFVIISLVYMSKKKWPISIICAALASTQNQPLVFLVALLWTKGMVDSKKKWKDFFILSLSAIPAFLPNIFYFIKFDTLSLLSKTATSLNNVSFFKVWEMFFDFNIGMLPYIPVTLLIFLGVVLRDGLLRRRMLLSVQLFLLMIIMMLFCALTINWNSGTSGPARYVIWMLPLVFYGVVLQDNSRITKQLYRLVLCIAIVGQVLIVFYGGIFICRIFFLEHNILAGFVLNNFPALYNPTKEIFIERTLGREGVSDTPVVYYYNNKCKKALVKPKDKRQLESLCGYIPKSSRRFFNNENSKEDRYINY